MKKFYVNGKIVYLNNKHSSLTAKTLLREVGLAGSFDHVCQALDKDQDLLGMPLDFLDVASEVEDYVMESTKDFPIQMEDADPDCYVLPNGKSAPYGLSGSELAALQEYSFIYMIDPLFADGVRKRTKKSLSVEYALVAVDRDLVFADRAKAVKAYNAIFGDLYGEI